MEIKKIKESVYGVEGLFLIKDGKLVFSDLGGTSYITNSISYLADVIKENRDLKKISIFAEKSVNFFFYGDYIVGVLSKKNINMPLLNLVVGRTMLDLEVPEVEEAPEVLDARYEFHEIVFEDENIFREIKETFKSRKSQIVLWGIQEKMRVSDILKELEKDYPSEDESNREMARQVIHFLEGLKYIKRIE